MGTKEGAREENLLNAIRARNLEAKPYGGICPPTSEQICASPICPRRPPLGYVPPQTMP